MSYGRGADVYQQTRVLGSSREQLVPLLYERLLADLRRADAAGRNGRADDCAAQLQHASDIIFELLASLDFDAGGELAGRLAALYAFFVSELTEIGRRFDVDRLRRLTEMIAALHDSWNEAAQTLGRPGELAR